MALVFDCFQSITQGSRFSNDCRSFEAIAISLDEIATEDVYWMLFEM
ncbi:MAG: hypothetical protein R3222_03845 [Balneolaceae bacterium]|nr:hypothetical protein [Balneolaceae bacterium]